MPESDQLTKPFGFAGGPKHVAFKTESTAPTIGAGAGDFNTNQAGFHRKTGGRRSWVLNDGGTLLGAELLPKDQIYHDKPTYLVATGTAATDYLAFKATLSALVAAGGGDLILSGVHTWPVNDPDTGAPPYLGIPASINLRMLRGAKIVAGTGGAYVPRIDIGGSAPDMSTGTAFAGINRFASDFAQPGGIVAGDYLAMWSDDELTEMLPEETPGKSYPGCIRKVMAIEGTRVILNAPVPDGMSTSPKYRKVTMYDGVRWENCHIENLTLVASTLANARFEGLTLINCGTIGIGAFNFGACFNASLSESLIDNNGITAGIGTTVGMSHGVDIHGNTIIGSGHMTDSGRGRQIYDDPNWKSWGGPDGFRFRDNRLFSWRNSAGGNQPIDTHAMGYDIWINNNEIHLNGYVSAGVQTAITSAIRARARKMRVTGNKIFGPAEDGIDTSVWGVNVDGAGGIFCQGNIYSRVSAGIYLFDTYGGHTICDETFLDLSHHAIRVDTGASAAETLIDNIRCRNHNGRGFGGESKSWIRTQNGSKVVITGSHLRKAHANMANSVVAEGAANTKANGNHCYGWGASSHGMTGAGLASTSGNFTD